MGNLSEADANDDIDPTSGFEATSIVEETLTSPVLHAFEFPDVEPSSTFDADQEDAENADLLDALKRREPYRFVEVDPDSPVICTSCSISISPPTPFYRHLDMCEDSELCQTCFDNLDSSLPSSKWYFRHTQRPEAFMRDLKASSLGVTSLLETLFTTYASRPYVGTRLSSSSEEFTWTTFREVHSISLQIARSLHVLLRVKRPSFVGILASIRPEVPMIWYGSIFAGSTFVPIQRIMSIDEKRSVLEVCECDVLFCQKSGLAEVREGQFRSLVPFIVVLDWEEEDEEGGEEGMMSWDQFLRLGIENENENVVDLPVTLESDDLVMIMHTSGTTGRPKGITMNESLYRNWITRDIRKEEMPFIGLCFIPLSHISGMCEFLRALFVGGRIGILCQSDLTNVFKDFQILRPTFLITMPRLIVFAYNEYHRRLRHESEETVREEMATLFGDRVWSIHVGSAYCSPEVKGAVRSLVEIPIRDIYGATEVGWISSNYRFVPWNEVKLADCPELGYSSNDKPYPRGELLIRNEKVKQWTGYYKMPEVTASKFDPEGYFRTGDVVEIQGDRVFIIDRTSNILKLGQGEFISLEKVEATLETSDLIDQVVAFANTDKTRLVAIVKVFDEGVSKRDVVEDFHLTASRKSLNSWEIPEFVFLTLDPLPLTEMKKKSRRRIKDRFQKELAQLCLDSSTSFLAPIADDDNSFRSFLLSLLETDELAPDSTWESVGGDSFRGVALLRELQSLGVVSIEYSELLKMSLGDVIALAEEATEGDIDVDESLMSQPVTFEEEKAQMETLVSELAREYDSSRPREAKTTPTTIFLTGGSGFLGKVVFASLRAEFPSAQIVCLVRRQRRREDDCSAEVDEEDDEVTKELIVGDLSSPRFGLSEDDFASLSDRVDLIVHCASKINHFTSYRDHYDANVRSCFDMVRLAKGWKPMVYVSSLGVWGSSDSACSDLASVEHLASSGYSASKWVADLLFSTYQPSNCAVIRPSLIGPSTVTGECNVRDWLCRYLHAMLSLGCVPDAFSNGGVPLDLVPVNAVAEAIIRLSRVAFDRVFTSSTSSNFVPINVSYANTTVEGLLRHVSAFLDLRAHDTHWPPKVLPMASWLEEIRSRGSSLPVFPFVSSIDLSSAASASCLFGWTEFVPRESSGFFELLSDDSIAGMRYGFRESDLFFEMMMRIMEPSWPE